MCSLISLLFPLILQTFCSQYDAWEGVQAKLIVISELWPITGLACSPPFLFVSPPKVLFFPETQAFPPGHVGEEVAASLAWLCALRVPLCSATGMSQRRACGMLRALGLALPCPPQHTPKVLDVSVSPVGPERAVVALWQNWPGLCFSTSLWYID